MSEGEQVIAIVCGADSFHPYECDGPGKCIHCDEKKSDRHDPANCALCRSMDPEPTP